jgi:hypothetical protein
MLTLPTLSDEDVTRLVQTVLLKEGTYPAEIRGAHDTKAEKSRRDMIRATAVVFDAEGIEHELPIFLHTAKAGLPLLVHTARALKLNPGTISAEDVKGLVRVVVGIEPKRGRWPARNTVLDILPADTADVVPLRAAG